MTSAQQARRTRAGRPRHTPETSGLTPRQQILDASAQLFTIKGFAGTSTRDIAEKVGIRQASIYYHFAGKDEILAELLEMTVRPALESLVLLDDVETPEARLYLLALSDARDLARLDHNIGILPWLPDVTKADVTTDEYDAASRELRAAYTALGLACASAVVLSTIGKAQLGGLLLGNVESVVRTRTTGHTVSERELHNIAATCLRVCGVTDDRIDAARDAAGE